VINHCDRRITHLGDTDISFGLFKLFACFYMPFGVIVSTTLKVKKQLEDIFNRTKDISKSP
jgi:hypothetical protein